MSEQLCNTFSFLLLRLQIHKPVGGKLQKKQEMGSHSADGGDSAAVGAIRVEVACDELQEEGRLMGPHILLAGCDNLKEERHGSLAILPPEHMRLRLPRRRCLWTFCIQLVSRSGDDGLILAIKSPLRRLTKEPLK